MTRRKVVLTVTVLVVGWALFFSGVTNVVIVPVNLVLRDSTSQVPLNNIRVDRVVELKYSIFGMKIPWAITKYHIFVGRTNTEGYVKMVGARLRKPVMAIVEQALYLNSEGFVEKGESNFKVNDNYETVVWRVAGNFPYYRRLGTMGLSLNKRMD